MTGSIKDLLLFRWAALGLLALLSCLLTVVLYRAFKKGRVPAFGYGSMEMVSRSEMPKTFWYGVVQCCFLLAILWVSTVAGIISITTEG